MRRVIQAVILALLLLLTGACGKLDGSLSSFTIIGKWAMESGTITNEDGSTRRYENLGAGTFYQYIEYRVDGSYIQTALPSGLQTWGVYTYNDATHSFSYKEDGYQYFVPGTITILSGKKMIITSDFGPSGSITKHMVKLYD